MDELYDVIIIGGGPAGLTAAIYASRANLKTLVIESGVNGGKLHKTHQIENYPGVTKTEGKILAAQLEKHSQEFGAQILNAEVERIDDKGDVKDVVLTLGIVIQTKTVIIATGTKERMLKIDHAMEFIGNGISYCAVCDGFFYRNKKLVVIGAGNSGMEESLFLADSVSHITIIEMFDHPLAEARIVENVNKNEKIDVIYSHTADELVIENGQITGLIIKDVNTNEKMKLECDGIFPYMGADPCTSFVDKSILDDREYIVVNPDMSTSIKGIYAAGDCIQKGLRQVVTACNDGAIAANSVSKYLKN